MSYNNVQNADGVFVRPCYGVGYGGQGTWFNRHFATREEAEMFFTSEVARLQEIYAGNKGTRRYATSEICPPSLERRWSIVNVKGDGKTGKLRQTVHLYAIKEEA